MAHRRSKTPNLDARGRDWRDWVLSNIDRQCSPLVMFGDMVKGDWSHEEAAAALDEGLALRNRPADWRFKAPRLPGADRIEIDGVTVNITMRMSRPMAALIEPLIAPDECEALIALAAERGFERSQVVDDGTGGDAIHHERTSSNVCFARGETPLIARLEYRLSRLTDWPVTHAEGLQIIRYRHGQEYKAHYDWFNSAAPSVAKHVELGRGGRRLATTVLYLSSPDEGGDTYFPKVGVQLKPHRGGAVFFHNVDPMGQDDDLSLHGGRRVVSGEKIIATYWQREAETS